MDIDTLEIFQRYMLAILLGSLLGLERERRDEHPAGLRTFILVTLFGSICGQISVIASSYWLLFAGMLAITAQSAMAHFQRARDDSAIGLTTSVALLVAFGIGVLIFQGQTMPAIFLSFATTIILYFKPQMHEFSHNLSPRDLHAIFQFVLIAFIILPILPDQDLAPYRAINPYNVWLMVVVISAINLTGYIAMKFVGQRWHGPLLGILGGLISSTATTLSFSRHAKAEPGFSVTGAVIVSLASTLVLARIAILVGLVYPELLSPLTLPLTAMFLGGLLPVFLIWRQASKQDAPLQETRNPVELKQALIFGLLYALVLLAVSAGKDFMGDRGVYVVSMISGFADVDAIILTNARLAKNGILGVDQASICILIAYVANLVFKLAMVGIIGTLRMFRWVAICFTALTLPALIVFW